MQVTKEIDLPSMTSMKRRSWEELIAIWSEMAAKVLAMLSPSKMTLSELSPTSYLK